MPLAVVKTQAEVYLYQGQIENMMKYLHDNPHHDQVDYYYILAQGYCAQKNYQRAGELLAVIYKSCQDNAGFMLTQFADNFRDHPNFALNICQEIGNLYPDYYKPFLVAGFIFNLHSAPKKALEVLRRANQLRPQHPPTIRSILFALRLLGQYDEIGQVYNHFDMGKIQDAMEIFYYYIYFCHQGDYKRGFAGFYTRCQAEHFQQYISQQYKPFWPIITDQPSNIPGKNIALLFEGGYGDFFMFMRYAPLLKHRANRVAVVVKPELARFANQLSYIDEVILIEKQEQRAQDYDVALYLFSLPHFMGTQLHNIPPAPLTLKNSLSAPPFMGDIPPNGKKGKKIGFIWQSSAGSHLRHVPLAQLLKHLPPHHQYFSLQKEQSEVDEQLLAQHGDIINCQTHIDDWYDTAAIIGQLDAVIAVDTALGNLAGALGARLFMLLPINTEWRWFCPQFSPEPYITSPWYPAATILRQQIYQDWAHPLQLLQQKLLEM